MSWIKEALELLRAELHVRQGARHVERLVEAGRWEEALAAVERGRTRALMDGRADEPTLLALDRAYLVAALHVGRLDAAKVAVAALSRAPVEERGELATRKGIDSLVGELSKQGRAASLLVLADLVDALGKGAWDPLPVRALCLAQRFYVLMDIGASSAKQSSAFVSADLCYRRLREVSASRGHVLDHAALRVRFLNGRWSGAWRVLSEVQVYHLSRASQLRYAALALQSPKRIQRVKALDVLGDSVPVDRGAGAAVRRLGRRWLAEVGEGISDMEVDRGARLLEACGDHEGLLHLRRLERLREARSRSALGGLLGDPRLLEGLELARGFLTERSLPKEARPERMRLTLSNALAPSRKGLEAIVASFEKEPRPGALRPLAALWPRLIQKWSHWSVLPGLRDLAERYLREAPDPEYGFYALGEAWVSAGEAVLAAAAMIRAWSAPDSLCSGPLKGNTRLASRRASRAVLAGVADLVERGEVRQARGLLLRWKQALERG